MGEIPTGAKIGVIVAGVFVALLVTLLPMSFGYLDYFELGFRRQKSTSRVFTDKVYPGGRHLIGPDFEFKKYPSTARNVRLTKTTVFSSDTLVVYIDIQFQYFLRPEQLPLLHRKYQLTYHAVIRSTAMDALKGAAVNFTTEQFIKDRRKVEEAMKLAVMLRVGGKCCAEDCSVESCVPSCIPMNLCTDEKDMGLMVNVRYFQLTRVQTPSKVYGRYLRALLVSEETQTERYRQEEAVVVKGVDEAVKTIMNQAEETAQNSTAEAKLITNKANAESLRIIGQARSEGLKNLMTLCRITDTQQKISYHYLGALATSSKVHMAVDFNNYVIGGR